MKKVLALLCIFVLGAFAQNSEDPKEFLKQICSIELQEENKNYIYQKMYEALILSKKANEKIYFCLHSGKAYSGVISKLAKDRFMLKDHQEKSHVLKYKDIKASYLAKFLLAKHTRNAQLKYYLGLLLIQEKEMRWAKRCLAESVREGNKEAKTSLGLVEKYFELLKKEAQTKEEEQENLRKKKQEELVEKKKQEAEEKKNQEDKKKKELEEVLSQWFTDYEKACEFAQKFGRPILVNFTGSDWCGWCIRLEEEVFSKPEFQEYAKKSLIKLKIDFPRQKKLDESTKVQNQKLASKYGVRGYPTILLIDNSGTQIAKTGYQAGGPVKYVEHLKKLLERK